VLPISEMMVDLQGRPIARMGPSLKVSWVRE
jgi:hypothetical protein